MRNVVFVDGMRTAFGRMGGGLRQYHTSELLGMAIRGLVEKTGIQERGAVDAVYAGSALADAHCYNIARFASLYAGLPYETSAVYIEMQCGSGIACINRAGLSIAAGEIDVAIAGGAETFFGKSKANTWDKMLSKVTVVLSVVFALVVIAMYLFV